MSKLEIVVVMTKGEIFLDISYLLSFSKFKD